MTNIVANLASLDEPEKTYSALVVNVSEHGARVVTVRQWPAGDAVVIYDPQLAFSAIGEVVYCQSSSANEFAIGLKFTDTLGLNSLFRPTTEGLETQRLVVSGEFR